MRREGGIVRRKDGSLGDRVREVINHARHHSVSADGSRAASASHRLRVRRRMWGLRKEKEKYDVYTKAQRITENERERDQMETGDIERRKISRRQSEGRISAK